MTPRASFIIGAAAVILLAFEFGGGLNRGIRLAWAGMQDSGSGQRREDDRDAASQPSGAAPAHGDEAKGEPASHEFTLDAAAQERIGLVLTTVKASTIRPEIRAVGVIEEDPAQSFTVRAPIAGFLQSDGVEWPRVGAVLDDHARVGAVQPRLTPLEQFALAGQTLEARSALAEIEAELAAAKSSYESKRTLNTDGKMVSDRQLEEAESKLKIARARLAGAQQKLALLDEQHSEVRRGLAPLPLEAVRGGQVVDVLVTPGEVVESGQALLRIARRDRLIARIELPLGELWESPTARARVAAAGGEDRNLAAKVIGLSPRSGARTRGQTWLLAIDDAGEDLASGTPLVAFLSTGGDPLEGVLVPRTAILRYGGLAWVFERGEHDTFERRVVRLHTPTPDGWFVTDGIEAGATIVERGAQILLSEQLKAQIEAEAEASE